MAEYQALAPFTFQPLPLGSIQPLGWTNDQLTLMADGLAGHQYDFYHIVRHSPWIGGDSEYSILNEGLPYWFNGLVPLAYGLNDSRLIAQVENATEYIVTHQWDDGWLGPEAPADRDLWARFPLFLGLTQLVEADIIQANKVIPAMHTFINLMHSMLVENTGLTQIWGRARFPDMLISLQWLYENYPLGNQTLMLDTMSLLESRGFDWSSYWTEDNFIFADLDTIQDPIDGDSPLFPFVHGVNAAQGLKAGATIYRFTGNDSLLQNNRNGVNWTFSYHGDPAGSIVGDERESSLSANRGSELCTAVETIYSMSYMYHTLGDNYFADRCERAAFNALPVSITADHWARQYLAVPSEPYAKLLSGNNPFWNVGDAGIIYGLEPNYPCCTVNMPQGLPKFLSASFVQIGDNDLGHALLGPAQVSFTTRTITDIVITCTTNYPFGRALYYNVTTTSPFTFYLRVPSWSALDSSSVSVNNNEATALTPDSHTGMMPVFLGSGTSTLTYTIGANIRAEQRANSTIAVYYGAILYALDVGQTVTTLANSLYNGSYSDGTPYNTSAPFLPKEVHDFAFTNTKPWNMAIDISSLTFHTMSNSTKESALQNPIFDYEAPPTYVSGKGCEIDWPLFNGLPAPLPALPEGVSNRNCTGNETDVVLRPYGSLKNHMAELPTVDLSVG